MHEIVGIMLAGGSDVVLKPVDGVSMVARGVDAMRKAGLHVMIVGGPATFPTLKHTFPYRNRWWAVILQPWQYGTADAAAIGLAGWAFRDPTHVIIGNADMPFVSRGTYMRLRRSIEARPDLEAHVATIDTSGLDEDSKKPFERLGRIVRSEDGLIRRVIEFEDAGVEERKNPWRNAGLYGFNIDFLRANLYKILPRRRTEMLDLPDVLRQTSGRIGEITISNPREAININSEEDYVSLTKPTEKT